MDNAVYEFIQVLICFLVGTVAGMILMANK